MSTLNVPNSIVDGAAVTAVDHQQNYDEIEGFINGNIIHADGSKAMNVGAELLLGAAGTANLSAVTKGQLDTVSAGTAAAIATAAADATSKANAAAVLGTANAKTYTDSVKIYKAFVEDRSGGNVVTNSLPQVILATGNITPTKAGHAIITATIDAAVKTVTGSLIDALVGEILVDGVVEPLQMVWLPRTSNVGDRRTISQTWIVARPSADTFDVRLQVKGSPGVNGSYDVTATAHTYIQCLMVG
jgi:hypothetical protein